MSKPEPIVLFLAETPDGAAKIAATQEPVPGGSVVLSLRHDGEQIAASLSREQAIGLAASILAVNVELLAGLAEHIGPQLSQQIAAGFLVPTAQAALLEQATKGATPQ